MRRILLTLLLVLSSSLFTLSLAQTGIINTIAGGGTGGLGDGGSATDAQFDGPYGIAIDKSGNIYISDFYSIRVRKVSAISGIINTIAGNGRTGYTGDGGLATAAEFGNPDGLALDSVGNLYIADNFYHVVRKIDSSTGIITTIAGNGYQFAGHTGGGFYGDGGPATLAELNRPQAVCLDKAGNLYIAEYYNNRIRRVDKNSGIITTIAGNGYGWWHGLGTFSGGYAGDGGAATDAELYGPSGIVVDDSNNIIISDCWNNVVREVNVNTSIITTIAGNNIPGYTGNGGLAIAAELYYPIASLDATGNMYIADDNNNVIRLVSKSTGIITTIAGLRTSGFSGDGGPATAAEMVPLLVMPVDSGNYYITDIGSNRIRKVSHDTNTITGIKRPTIRNQISVHPNPATDKITFDFNKPVNGAIEIYDVMGRLVLFQQFDESIISINCADFNSGIYLYKVVGSGGTLIKSDKVMVMH